MKKKYFMMAAILFVGLFMTVPMANSASIGVHCWNLGPYPDIVCFDVGATGYGYSLHGASHVSGSYRTPLDGSAIFDGYEGVIKLQWTWSDFSYSALFHMSAAISPATLNGTWADDTGDGGTLTYVGSGPQSSDTGSVRNPKMR